MRVWPLILAFIVPELMKFKAPLPTVPAPVMFDEVVRTEAATPVRKTGIRPLPLFRLTVPLPLRVNEFSRYKSVLLPSALIVIVPALLILPEASRLALLFIVSESPEVAERQRSGSCQSDCLPRVTAAVVRPMVTALLLVGTPAAPIAGSGPLARRRPCRSRCRPSVEVAPFASPSSPRPSCWPRDVRSAAFAVRLSSSTLQVLCRSSNMPAERPPQAGKGR